MGGGITALSISLRSARGTLAMAMCGITCCLIPLSASALFIVDSVDTYAHTEGYAQSEYNANWPGVPSISESGYENFDLTSASSCSDSASVELVSIGHVSALGAGSASAALTAVGSSISGSFSASAHGETDAFFEDFESLDSESSVTSEAHALVTFELTDPFSYDAWSHIAYTNYGPASPSVWLKTGSDYIFHFYDGDFTASGLLAPGTYEFGGEAEFVHAFSINLIDRSVGLEGSFGLTLASVPEPATLVLFGAGLLGICARYRRHSAQRTL